MLEFETAGLGSRILAEIVDLVVQSILAFGFFIAIAAFGVLSRSSALPSWVPLTMSILFITFVVFGYPIAMESLWRGRSLGKAAMGLRVVTTEGGQVRFRHAAIRGFFGFLDFYLTFGSVAVLSILFTRNNQRLGDLVAGTIVLRERTGAPPPRVIQFPVPRGYEDYVRSLDTSRLTAADYGTIRSFLMRATSLPVRVRADISRQIAGAVTERLAQQPPPTISAEVFLACAAASYQHRFSTDQVRPLRVQVPNEQSDHQMLRESHQAGDGGFSSPS